MMDVAAWISSLDFSALLPFILVGFAAQMVDGALGMAFGVICNTLLVGVLGVPPALASQRVHVVECFTTATSGISHLLHGNIDKRLFLSLVIPGVIGGVMAAPLAAWAAKHFPAKPMLILVGVVLTLTSLYGVYRAWG